MKLKVNEKKRLLKSIKEYCNDDNNNNVIRTTIIVVINILIVTIRIIKILM